MDAMREGIGNGLSSLWNETKALGSSIGGFFGQLGSDLGGWFSDVGSSFSSVLTDMGNGFKGIGDFFQALLNALNPFHEDFFLWVAFVPDQAFMDQQINTFNDTLNAKFGVFKQIGDTLDSVFDRMESTTWEGFKITLPQTGQSVTIVDPMPVQEMGHKVKFWSGGLLLFFMLAWVYRKITTEVIK